VKQPGAGRAIIESVEDPLMPIDRALAPMRIELEWRQHLLDELGLIGRQIEIIGD
jgi:hypothetical protein